MRLNRYVANSGICTRREADVLIAKGSITVNGEAVTAMGARVRTGEDVVRHNGKVLDAHERFYRLYNKPVGQGCVASDGRVTDEWVIMAKHLKLPPESIMHGLQQENCGLILLTNDLALRERVEKRGSDQLFHVTTAKPSGKDTLDHLLSGVETPLGTYQATEVKPVANTESGPGLGIRCLGWNDVVLMQVLITLGVELTKIDRVMIEGLTKLDLPRGRSRSLKDREVGFLKMKK